MQSIHKDNILYYKTVKIIINASGFTKVILNIVVCHHGFLGPVITNNKTFYPFIVYCHFVIFYVVFLPCSIYKPAALSKGQIAASKIYPLSF